jgi:hypothetical protein
MNKIAVAGIGVGAIAIGLYTGASIFTSKVAEAKIDDMIADLDDDVVVEYKNAKVNLLGANLTVNDVSVAPTEAPTQVVNIDQIIVRDFADQAGFPTRIDASVKGIHVGNSPSTAIAAPFLAQAGYSGDLALDLDTKYTYDKATAEVTLEQFRLGADEVGHIDVTFKLGNVDPQAVPSDTLTLHSVEIVYQDESLVENLLLSMATQSNQDVQQFKTQLKSDLAQNAQFFVSPDSPAAMNVVNEVTAFIEKPNGFSISVQPEQPLLISDLTAATNPQAWIDLLNLEIQSY